MKSQCDTYKQYALLLNILATLVLQHVPAHFQEHVHELCVQMQELRTQLHKDSQEHQELLDQQHDLIQQLEQQKQSLQVIAAMQSRVRKYTG